MATTNDATSSAAAALWWCAAVKHTATYVKDRTLRVIDDVFNFTDKWVCCNGVDDESVVENVQRIRDMQDGLAEEYLEFNHQAKMRHYTTQPTVIDIIDNEQPEMVMAQPATESSIGPNDRSAQMTTTMVGTALSTHFVVGDVMVPIITDDSVVVYGTTCLDGHGPTSTPVVTLDTPSGDHSPGSEAQGTENPTLVYTICHDVIEVKNSRRVATNGRHFYNAAVVAEIKNKLGLPKCTEANKLVVRRMARNIMEKHGVRPTHIRQSIEKVVAGVFVPDQYDIEASAMLSSNAVTDLRSQVNDSGPKNGWSTVKDFFRFGWRRTQTSRVPPVTGSP